VQKIIYEIDVDDPRIQHVGKFEAVPENLLTEKEIIEEEVCHGDNMGQTEDIIGEDMLSGDKSLKSNLLNERSKMVKREKAL
jgi:hypothetical protein